LSDEAAGSGSGYLAFTGFIHFSHTFARIDSAAGDIVEDLFASGLLESVLLQVRILIGRGNSCVADPHAQPPVLELKPDQQFRDVDFETGIATSFMPVCKPGSADGQGLENGGF